MDIYLRSPQLQDSKHEYAMDEKPYAFPRSYRWEGASVSEEPGQTLNSRKNEAVARAVRTLPALHG